MANPTEDADSVRDVRPTRGERWALAAILGLALVLRLTGLSAEGLSTDEGFSLRDAVWPPHGLNVLRPIYYSVLAGWIQLGHSDLWARGLSVLFGVAVVAGAWWLGRRTVGPRAALIGAALVAISPREIFQSQEIRMYTLAALLALAAAVAVLRLAERPSLATAAAWVGLRVAAVLTSPFTVTFLVADAFVLARRKATRWLGLVTGAAMAGAGLVLVLFPQPLHAAMPWWRFVHRPGLRQIAAGLLTWTADWPWRRFGPLPMFQGWWVPAILACGLVAILALFVVGARRAWRGDAGSVVLWALAHPAALLVLTLLSSPVWMSRYLYVASVYVCLVLGTGIAALWERRRPVAAVLLVALMGSTALALARQTMEPDHEDWRGVAQLLIRLARPGSTVAVTDPGVVSAIAHYTRDAGVSLMPLTVPLVPRPDPGFVRQALVRATALPQPFWLVDWKFGDATRHAIIRRAIEADFVVLEEHDVTGADVLLLSSRSAPSASGSPLP